MPAVARHTDTVLTGHQCDTETKIQTHSNNVFVNNLGAARQSDITEVHSAFSPPNCSPHTAPIHSGSPNVFVNNLAIARLNDPTDLGMITSGSANVFAN